MLSTIRWSSGGLEEFNFTGEIKTLNGFGASHHSFVEQLEHAFRTPAKIDLPHDFGNFSMANVSQCPWYRPSEYESRKLSLTSFPFDVNTEPPLFPGTDPYAATASVDDLLNIFAPQMMRKPSSVCSHPSDGELNRDSKFGEKAVAHRH